MRVVVGGVAHWLWRAVNEHGDVLDVLLQEHRDTDAARRFLRRLIDDQGIPERIVTDGLRSYGAALREVPELGASEHITVSAAGGFRTVRRAQSFLFTHAEVSTLFRYTRPHTRQVAPSQLAA